VLEKSVARYIAAIEGTRGYWSQTEPAARPPGGSSAVPRGRVS